MSCLCQDLALSILHDNAPGILVYLDAAVRRGIGYRVAHALRGPHLALSLGFEPIAEHYVVSILILGLNRCRQHTDSRSPWRDKLHLDLQHWVVLVGCIGEVEHLHTHWPIAIEVERLTRTQPVAFPLHRSLTLRCIETDDRVSKEIGIRQVVEVRRHILLHRLQILDPTVRL